MPRHKHLIVRRNAKIKVKFESLCGIKEDGVQKHSYEWILKQLEKEFDLSTFTIEQIIKRA